MHDPNAKMSDRLRNPGEGFIFAFPAEGSNVAYPSDDEVGIQKGYFFRVSKAERFYYEYDSLASFTQGETKDFGYLGENNHENDAAAGNDIFRLQQDDFKVYHFGVGMNTTDLRVFYKLSPSDPERHLDWENRGQPHPDDDPQWGWFDGRQANDRFDPPAFTERVSIRTSSTGGFLEWGFRATEALSSAETRLWFVGRTYELLPVTDQEVQDKMISAVVEDQQEPEIPTTLHSAGDVFTYRLGTSLPDGWEDLRNGGLERELNFGVEGR